MNKKYIAEGLGAFLLSFVVLTSANSLAFLPTPIQAMLTLMLLVFAIGRISGAHVNPAISIGLWSVGKLKAVELPYYIVSQVLGALLAKIAAGALGTSMENPITVTKNMEVMIAEGVGTAVFAFVIASVVWAKNLTANSAPFFVGMALLLGLTLATGLGSAGVLNPAVALALDIKDWIYYVSSVAGAVLGFNIYKLIAND